MRILLVAPGVINRVTPEVRPVKRLGKRRDGGEAARFEYRPSACKQESPSGNRGLFFFPSLPHPESMKEKCAPGMEKTMEKKMAKKGKKKPSKKMMAKAEAAAKEQYWSKRGMKFS